MLQIIWAKNCNSLDYYSSSVVKWPFYEIKRVSRYGRCLMIDSGSTGYPEQESAGCHFGNLGRNFLRAKIKWPPDMSKSNMIFSANEARNKCNTSFLCDFDWAIHFCNLFKIQGHLQGQISENTIFNN